jgi:4-alpha-glucanotransferase
LHLTSLSGPHGSGDLGEEAVAFADALARAEQRWWQMLPIGPAGYGDSPYSAASAFAGDPILVDLRALGIPLDEARFPTDVVDFADVRAFREAHLARAHASFAAAPRGEHAAFDAFCTREAAWLDDYALYASIKRAEGGAAWVHWPAPLRDREPAALAAARASLARDIERARFVQFRFDEQWSRLRAACAARGVALLGDVPIFVAHDSADVWAHRDLFFLDDAGAPTVVAGVPPDYFSKTGQRWGNPLYRWKRLAARGFDWWVARMKKALSRFDAVRLDHFIGFARYWEVPASEPTAMHGRWRRGPGRALFDALEAELGALPLVAEDLGAVTPGVRRLRRGLGLPGIRLAQFAFGTDPQAPTFLPHAHPRRAVVYTGTHDNDTTVGWFFDPGGEGSSRSPEETEDERRHALAYLGRNDAEVEEIHWAMIRLVWGSVAHTAIVPMQDVLGLGTEARMNRPGTSGGSNWRWRMAEPAPARELERLAEVTRTYGRAARRTRPPQG